MTGAEFDRHHYDYSPWWFWRKGTPEERAEQLAAQQRFLEQNPSSKIGERCFLSPLAAVQTTSLVLGDGSYIAAHAYLTDDVVFGRDCTVNVGTVVRGDITVGDAVRIGAHTSILAFNHGMSDPDVEVFRQPMEKDGITIGDDVWIGSHVVILDGVSVGSRSVIAAGSVVTKDVPAGAIVAGNPARVKRWRVPSAAPSPLAGLEARLVRLEEHLRADLGDILDRSWIPDLADGRYVDRPGHPVTVRAHCDAVEIADTVARTVPSQLSAAEHVARLRGLQDPTTGLVPEYDADGRPQSIGDGDPSYHVLCVGYALDLLRSAFPSPVTAFAELDPAAVVARLDALPWDSQAWHCGSTVDTFGTALLWNLNAGTAGVEGAREALFGWLTTRVDPVTGMWGRPAPQDGMLQVVNGFYRGTRGTYAQFGVPLPYPEKVVDTVLSHVRDERFFDPSRYNACNVLDVAHPLWLARRQTTHRREEAEAVAVRLLDGVLDTYVRGEGFGFAAPSRDGHRHGRSVPGLQGTEMWVSTIWLLADLAGLSEAVELRPRGIHRPEPARRPLG
ncbi:DapH/DapD/GlmU-related protein [Pseudonocardia sp. MH-G8]|uniref:acyltransferase n=1 Tax=Pseudonocardia sp. MH-G8 TaxID=1854588 RepID=UPI000BA16E18|nr:acyltransferase [Pseudonocardia sp. MH-G8]OZM75803.1 acetyltransferase [Pseudonocardia sp. MH-G8]